MNTKSVESALASVQDAQLMAPDSDEQRADLIYEAISGVEVDGLFLRAPAQIDMTTSMSWPVMVVSGLTLPRARSVDMGKNAMLFIVPLDSAGPIISAPAFPVPKGKIPMPPSHAPAPLSIVPDSQRAIRSKSVRVFDLKSLENPLPAGRYALTLIAYDWKSNTTVVELIGSATRDASGTNTPQPGLVPELHLSATAPGSAELGISIVPESGWTVRSSEFVMEGQVRMRLDARWMTEASAANNQLRAQIPAHLVLVEQDLLRPTRVRLTFPVHSEKPVGKGDVLSGLFRVDLKNALRDISPSTQMAYMFSDTTVSGPIRMVVGK